MNNIQVADYDHNGGADTEVDILDMGEPHRIEEPTEFGPKYTEQDQKDVVTVIDWLNRTGKSQSWLSRTSRVNSGTLNQVIKGTYAASPSKWLAALIDAVRLNEERSGQRGIPFVETSVFKLAASVYYRARTYRNIGVLSCSVGTGKTTAAKEFKKRHTNVYLVECLPDLTTTGLLDDLCTQLSLVAEARGLGKEGKLKLIIGVLKDSDGLLIIDEAETMQPEALHYVRRIRDLAGIGLVLQGATPLIPLVKAQGGKFDQIRSRVGFWPAAVQAISREDADEIALSAFDDLDVPPPQDVLDAMWHVSGGSARVLAEQLIPSIRDYGLRKGRALSSGLVRQIAAEVLNMGVGAATKRSAA